MGDQETNNANARRIVACVNACEGSPTEAIEEMLQRGLSFGKLAFAHATLLESIKDLPSGDELRESGRYLEQVVHQRGELLAALQSIRAEFERLKGLAPSLRDACYLDGVLAVISTRSSAAIASVKGGAKAPDTTMIERDCCGTFFRTPHRSTCPNYRGKKGSPQ